MPVNYLRKINENRAPAGLERALLRLAPRAALASLLIPALVAFAARAVLGPAASKTITSIDIAMTAVAVTSLTAVFTVAIGAVIVFVMKGPGYVADAYEVGDAAEPAPAAVSHTRTDRSGSDARPGVP